MTDVTLYLVRHGETYFNRYNKLQGWSNSPLTQAGLDQAQAAGERLRGVPFAAAYCSDTTRAETTARTVLAASEASTVRDPVTSVFFREEFYGSFEGSNMDWSWYQAGAPHGAPSFERIVGRYSMGHAKDFLKAADPFHDAEDDVEYWRRVDQGFDLIRDAGLRPGADVLLISHGNTLLSLMDRFGGGRFDLTVRPANGSVTRIRLTDDDLVVLGYNE